MARSTVQLEVENWIRDKWLPDNYGQQFTKKKVPLTCGGEFEFDAVGENPKTVVVISTSSAKTASGGIGHGKVRKIRSDLYFLLLIEGAKRIVVFTETDMFEFWKKEQETLKRVPEEIEFVPAVHIPIYLRHRLDAAKRTASEEVRPQ